MFYFQFVNLKEQKTECISLLNIEEFEDKLVIKESSNKLWIFIVLIFIAIWTWYSFNFNGLVFGIWGILSVAFVFIGYMMATDNEIVINNKTRELIINRKGFFSFNHHYQKYKFNDLSETIEFEKKRVGRSENYFAYVRTSAKKKVELFDSSSFDEDEFFTLYRLSNQYFIGLTNKDFQLPII